MADDSDDEVAGDMAERLASFGEAARVDWSEVLGVSLFDKLNVPVEPDISHMLREPPELPHIDLTDYQLEEMREQSEVLRHLVDETRIHVDAAVVNAEIGRHITEQNEQLAKQNKQLLTEVQQLHEAKWRYWLIVAVAASTLLVAIITLIATA